MIQFQSYIINSQNLHPLIIKDKGAKSVHRRQLYVNSEYLFVRGCYIHVGYIIVHRSLFKDVCKIFSKVFFFAGNEHQAKNDDSFT